MIGRFLATVAAVWLCSWLPIGLWVGDPDFVLTKVSRGSAERELYQILFYGGLFLVFCYFWKHYSPAKPRGGRPGEFLFYFVQGTIATLVLRGLLSKANFVHWELVSLDPLRVLQILAGCLAVALVEEALFRGLILGSLVQKIGLRKGLVLSSALFALVHLFRPGDWLFKLSYFVGLFLLGLLLGSIAWRHNSILASAGFHGGLILLNISTEIVSFRESFWSGYNSDTVSGAASIVLTLLFFGIWTRLPDKWLPMR